MLHCVVRKINYITYKMLVSDSVLRRFCFESLGETIRGSWGSQVPSGGATSQEEPLAQKLLPVILLPINEGDI